MIPENLKAYEIAPLRDKLAAEAQQLLARSGDTLTEADQTRFGEIEADLDALKVRADEHRTKLAEARRIAQLPGHTESTTPPASPELMQRVSPWQGDDVQTLARGQARDRALKALEDKELTRHLNPRQLDHLDRLLRVQTDDCDGGGYLGRLLLLSENEHYRTAFQETVINPTHPVLDADQTRAVRDMAKFRAMSIGTDTAGGFGVPVLIDPTIVLSAQGSPNDIMAIARVETITTDEWRGVSSAGVSWSFDDEAEEASDDTPTLAQPTVPTHRATGFVPFSIEVGMDYPNFAQELATVLMEGYNELLAEKLTTGSGTGEPTGIITALDADVTAEVVVTTDGALAVADLYKLWDALPIKFRRRPDAAWMSSTDVMNEVRNFGTTMGSNFTIDLKDEAIPRLFGRQYYENDFMADFTGATTAVNLMVLGAWKYFVVAQRAGMSVEVVPHMLGSNRRPNGQRGMFAWARIGSNCLTTKAFKLLQNQ